MFGRAVTFAAAASLSLMAGADVIRGEVPRGEGRRHKPTPRYQQKLATSALDHARLEAAASARSRKAATRAAAYERGLANYHPLHRSTGVA